MSGNCKRVQRSAHVSVAVPTDRPPLTLEERRILETLLGSSRWLSAEALAEELELSAEACMEALEKLEQKHLAWRIYRTSGEHSWHTTQIAQIECRYL